MDDNLKDRVALGHAMVERHIVFFEESFGHVTSQWKYDGSRVTEADLALSKAFEADLSERFPEDCF
jgi:myo-inositol-1(or 4)-monophosphatase